MQIKLDFHFGSGSLAPPIGLTAEFEGQKSYSVNWQVTGIEPMEKTVPVRCPGHELHLRSNSWREAAQVLSSS